MHAIPQPGATIGGYRLVEEVARGGQGAVFRAERAGVEGRVALKLLLDLDPESVARFEREALQLARVEHPNVVRVHDYGVHEGKPFLAMEWIEGVSLHERVRTGGALAPAEAVEVLGQVGRALAHCHERGIVHRDVKPHNVVLRPDGGAVLVDFGLVGRTDGHGGALSRRLTVTGEILGTPAYMAPEQADPRFGTVGPGTDVYALGATLYYALTGAAPLDTRGGLTQVLLKLLEGPPADPRRVAQVSDPLAELVIRCQGKRAAQRPRGAADFVTALEALDDEGARVPFAAWGVLAFAVVGGLVVALGGLGRSEPPSPATVAAPQPTASAAPVASEGATPAPTPPPPETRWGAIDTLIRTGHPLDAWRLIEPLLAEHPKDVELLDLGRQALSKLPKFQERRFHLLVELQQTDRPTIERAVEAGCLALAIALEHKARPKNRHLWLNRAWGVLHEVYDRNQELSDESRRLVFWLGRTRGNLARWNLDHGTLKLCRRDLHHAQSLLGRLREKGAYQVAARAEQAQLESLFLELGLRLGLRLKRLQRRVWRAKAAWEEVVDLAPNDVRGHRGLAVFCNRNGYRRRLLSQTRRRELLIEAEYAYVETHRTAVRNPLRANHRIYARLAGITVLSWDRRWASAAESVWAALHVPWSTREARRGLVPRTRAVFAKWARADPVAAEAFLRAGLDSEEWRKGVERDGNWRVDLGRMLLDLVSRR